jgi:hypothetical protein
MSTSNSYSFGTLTSRGIIEDAYQRIGIIPSLLTQEHIASAERSANFILQSWTNKHNNLWTIRHAFINLIAGQTEYDLPPATVDAKIVMVRTSVRALAEDGVPFSDAGGNAAFAFDGNPKTACTQTSIGGFISYQMDVLATVEYMVQMIGIQSNVTTTYTLVAEYYDGTGWQTSLRIPTQIYTAGVISWFNIPTQVLATKFRIRQELPTPGPEIPLDIQELYFNNLINDRQINRMSEDQYTRLPSKCEGGLPNSFWINRQIIPKIFIWPVPEAFNNCLYFSYWIAIQNLGTLLDSPEIPARFLEALVAGLAYKLSVKLAAPPDRVQLLKMESEETFDLAGIEDTERVPINIYPDLSGYYNGA